MRVDHLPVSRSSYGALNLYGWSSNYGNVVPNTSNVGIPWNANEWGAK